MNTPKFDAFVAKFVKAGVAVKVTKTKLSAKAFYSMEMDAVISSGEWKGYSLIVGSVTKEGTESIQKNSKMVKRIFG